MQTNNHRFINRRSFVHAAASAALLPHSFLSAAQQFMAPSQWHGVGPASSDGTIFVVGNTFARSFNCDWSPHHQTLMHSADAVFISSFYGHDLQADRQSLSQQSNLLVIGVSDPGNNALVGFNDLAHGFDQQIIASDLEDLFQLCSNPSGDPVSLRISVGTGQGEPAGSQALRDAVANIQSERCDQSASTGTLFMAIAANVGSMQLATTRALCHQLRLSTLGHLDMILTLVIDHQLPKQAIRVTLLARR